MPESSEQNPYQMPASQVVETGSFTASHHPRSVPAGNGFAWIGTGWALFKRAPGALIVMTLIYMIINLVLGSSVVAAVLGPLFLGGYFIVLDRVDQTGDVRIEELFAPFQSHLVPLLMLGLLLVGSSVVLFGLAFVLGLGTILGSGSDPGAGSILFVVGLALVAVLLFVLIYTVVFYAVILVVLGQQGIGESLTNSLSAFVKNILPFLLNGVAALIIVVIALIPAGLGLLVATPVLFGAMYASFRDIFAAE